MSRLTKGEFWIWLSIALALSLSILPLPIALRSLRPEWVMMVLIYWAIALPLRVSIGTAWICGIMLDVLLGNTLGVHALSLSVVIYLASFQFQKIRNFSLWQQSLLLGGFALIGKLLLFWGEHLFSRNNDNLFFFWSTLTTMLLWPWVFLTLRKLRRTMQIQ